MVGDRYELRFQKIDDALNDCRTGKEDSSILEAHLVDWKKVPSDMELLEMNRFASCIENNGGYGFYSVFTYFAAEKDVERKYARNPDVRKHFGWAYKKAEGSDSIVLPGGKKTFRDVLVTPYPGIVTYTLIGGNLTESGDMRLYEEMVGAGRDIVINDWIAKKKPSILERILGSAE